MGVYGKEFAGIYDRNWTGWSDDSWPDLKRFVWGHNAEAETWLDICCGTGRLIQLAAADGFKVSGIDASRHQLTHARRRVPEARLYRMDVRKMRIAGKFDVVTCMYDSLNYLLKAREIGGLFGKVRRLLSPAGMFIFDINTEESHKAYWNRSGAWQKPDHVLVQTSSYDQAKRLAKCHITGFMKAGKLYRRFDEVHVQRSYPSSLMEEMLRRAGFAFRTYDRTPGKAAHARHCEAGLLYVCLPRVK